LRLKASTAFEVFSVDLDEWMNEMTLPKDGTVDSQHQQKIAKNGKVVTISFIQVCRNYVRSYDTSWASLNNQSFLEYLYKSGTAFYVFPGCSIIDAVASIRCEIRNNGKLECTYAPCFISIKSRKEVSKIKYLCGNMTDAAMDAQCEHALCLLVLFGLDVKEPRSYTELVLKRPVNVAAELFPADNSTGAKIVVKVLRIPENDHFGLTQACMDITSESEEISEIYASHSFFASHERTALEAKRVLRTSTRRRKSDPEHKDLPAEMLTKLATQLQEKQK
jgi:hypothetical protein